MRILMTHIRNQIGLINSAFILVVICYGCSPIDKSREDTSNKQILSSNYLEQGTLLYSWVISERLHIIDHPATGADCPEDSMEGFIGGKILIWNKKMELLGTERTGISCKIDTMIWWDYLSTGTTHIPNPLEGYHSWDESCIIYEYVEGHGDYILSIIRFANGEWYFDNVCCLFLLEDMKNK